MRRLSPVILCLALLPLATAAADAPGIYRWRDAHGRLHLADRPPPGVVAETIEPETLRPNLMDGGPHAVPATRPERHPRRSATAEPKESKTQTRCRALTVDLGKIDTRMRRSYGLAEGERLRERRRELDKERFSLRCHDL